MSTDAVRAVYLTAVGREPSSFLEGELRPGVVLYNGAGALGGFVKVDHRRLDRAPRSPESPLDRSPLQEDVRVAQVMRGDTQEQCELVIDRGWQNIADHATAVSQARGEVLVCLETESVPLASRALTSFHRAKPGHAQIGFYHMPMPGSVEPQEYLATGRELERLERDRVLTNVILLDPRSPFARQSRVVGESGQDRYVGRMMAQAICAHIQDEDQPSLADMMTRMGRRYPYTGLATKSVAVPVGKKLWWWTPFEKVFHLGVRGYSDPGVIVNRALDLVRQLVEDPSLRCVDAPIDVDASPLFVLLTAPLQLKDRARWQALRDDFEVRLPSILPNATAVLCSGQGVQDRNIPDPFYLQVSLFYGVERLPGTEGLEEAQELLRLPAPQAAGRAQGGLKPRRRGASRVQDL